MKQEGTGRVRCSAWLGRWVPSFQFPDCSLYVIKAGIHPSLLRLKQKILLLRLLKVRLKLINLLLQIRYLVSEFRYCWRCFVHNLILGYARDERPNDPSSATRPTRRSE